MALKKEQKATAAASQKNTESVSAARYQQIYIFL